MVRFYSLLLTLTAIMNLQMAVYGKCFFTPLQSSYIGSRPVYKCVYHDLEFRVGTKFNITDCYKCQCDLSGFSCCGSGVISLTIDVPGGYKVVQYPCDHKLVKPEGEVIAQ